MEHNLIFLLHFSLIWIVKFTVKDLHTKTKRSYLQNYHLDDKDQKFVRDNIFPQELPSNAAYLSISPSGKKMAIFLTENKQDYQIQIYEKSFLLCSICTGNSHSKVYTDDIFSSFCWNKQENKLVYVAEEKMDPKNGFFEKKQENVGNKFEFQDNWGDSLSYSISPRPFIVDIEKKVIFSLKIDSHISVAQPQFCNDGTDDIVFVGYDNNSGGIGFCFLFVIYFYFYISLICRKKTGNKVLQEQILLDLQIGFQETRIKSDFWPERFQCAVSQSFSRWNPSPLPLFLLLFHPPIVQCTQKG